MTKSFGINFDDLEAKSKKESVAETRTTAQTGELREIHRKKDSIRRERVVSVDPKRCKMWEFADRDALGLNEEECKDLLDTMSPPNKQLIPALGRKLNDDPNFDYELIYGNRRRWVCDYYNINLEVKLTDDDDTACLRYMHDENAPRKDISAMERARSFYRQLNAVDKDGNYLFATDGKPSLNQLAKHLTESRATIQRAVNAAPLWDMKEVCEVLGDVRSLSIPIATKLVNAKQEDPKRFDSAVKLLKKENSKNKNPLKAPAAAKRLLAIFADTTSGVPQNRKYLAKGAGEVTLKSKPNGSCSLSFHRDLFGLSKDDYQALVMKIYEDNKS
jgi:ParB/RepB/Spo0J family partition protein